MRTSRGFTLIELMVSISILAVLAGIGSPMLKDFLNNSRVSATANDFFGMVNLARSEAIRRNNRVTLCALGADNRCATTAQGGVWRYETYGWALFEEDSATGASTRAGAMAPDDKKIRVQSSPATGVLVRGSFGWATFSPLGQVRMNGASFGGAVKVCRLTGTNACEATVSIKPRCVIISRSGSPSVMIPTGAAATRATGATTGPSAGCA